jgi:hypothetical protein
VRPVETNHDFRPALVVAPYPDGNHPGMGQQLALMDGLHLLDSQWHAISVGRQTPRGQT